MADKLEQTRDSLVAEAKRLLKKYRKKNPKSNTPFTRDYWRQNSKIAESEIFIEYASFPEFVKEALADELGTNRIQRSTIDVVKSHTSKKAKKYFVTAVIPNSDLDQPFFAAIQTFLKAENAELVVLPMRGIHHTHIHYNEEVEMLADHFVTEYQLSSNIKAMDAQIPPMTPDPTASCKRLAKLHSLIIAHPVQNMRSMPVLDITKPKVIISTGTMTKRKYPKTASGFKGELDAVLGGVIVEVDPKTDRFFWRFVQAGKDGSFYDLDKQYAAKGVKAAKAEALIVGDVHSGFTLDYARAASIEMANRLKVKTLAGGDWSDCYSVSHHHENNITVKVLKYEQRKDLFSIEAELTTLGEELLHWRKELNKDIEIDIVASNHDEHFTKYLQQQRFFDDVINYRISLDLAGWCLDGLNPIQMFVERKFPQLRNAKINWLERTTIKKVTEKGTIISQHGDLGPNGARCTDTNAEWSYQESVLQHSHTPSVLRCVKRVGTLALGLEYAKGPSGWQVMNCVLYPNGSFQMLWIAPDGKYHL